MQIQRAQRKRAKLRIGIAAPSGAGKTYSSLLIASGIVGPAGKIGVIDTEHESASLYDDLLPGGFDVIVLRPPFEPKRYVEAIRTFEREGYDAIIIDSLSHAWAGEGGSLDKKDRLSAGSANGFAAWRLVTPDHNALVEAILQSPAHVIANMRSKTDYVLEDGQGGKKVPKKVGMAPVMRDGIEYEFTVMFELDMAHNMSSTKDRTRLFDGRLFTPTVGTGEQLVQWLEKAPPPPPEPTLSEEQVSVITVSSDKATQDRILAAYNVKTLDKIPARYYEGIVKRLGVGGAPRGDEPGHPAAGEQA